MINIKVFYGYAIPDLANVIQRRVKEEVELMTGTKVKMVDIFVQGIDFSNTTDMEMGEQYA